MKKVICLLFFTLCCLESYSQQDLKCKYILEGSTNYEVFDSKEGVLKLDSVNKTLTIPDFGYNSTITIKIKRTENKPFRDSETNYQWYYGDDKGGESYILVKREKQIHLFWLLDEVNIKEFILSID